MTVCATLTYWVPPQPTPEFLTQGLENVHFEDADDIYVAGLEDPL